MNLAQADEGAEGVFHALTPKNQERLLEILSQHLPEAIAADRIIEQKTGYSSEICRNMKADVLAHLAILAERQAELNEDQQASQLAKIEEHLRRAIVEHPEEVLRNRIVEVEELWIEYQRVAVPFRTNNQLHEVPRHKELEELRHRIDALMDSARQTKPDETTWEESLTAAANMTQAADLASELADKLQQCIGKGHQLINTQARDKADKKRWGIGVLVAIAMALVTLFGGYLLGKGSDDQAQRAAKGPHVAAESRSPGTEADDKQNEPNRGR